jgi:hypothetical protein
MVVRACSSVLTEQLVVGGALPPPTSVALSANYCAVLTSDEHVNVQRAMERCKRLNLSCGSDLVSVAQPDAEAADLDDLGLGQRLCNVGSARGERVGA